MIRGLFLVLLFSTSLCYINDEIIEKDKLQTLTFNKELNQINCTINTNKTYNKICDDYLIDNEILCNKILYNKIVVEWSCFNLDYITNKTITCDEIIKKNTTYVNKTSCKIHYTKPKTKTLFEITFLPICIYLLLLTINELFNMS